MGAHCFKKLTESGRRVNDSADALPLTCPQPSFYLLFGDRDFIEFLRLGSGVRQALNFQSSCLSTGDYRSLLPSPAQCLFLTAKEREQDPPDQRTALRMISAFCRHCLVFPLISGNLLISICGLSLPGQHWERAPEALCSHLCSWKKRESESEGPQIAQIDETSSPLSMQIPRFYNNCFIQEGEASAPSREKRAIQRQVHLNKSLALVPTMSQLLLLQPSLDHSVCAFWIKCKI